MRAVSAVQCGVFVWCLVLVKAEVSLVYVEMICVQCVVGFVICKQFLNDVWFVGDG